jgi:hypothetical protein
MPAAKMTVAQVVAKRNELENRDSSRNNGYDEVLQFYAGDTYRNVKKKGFLPGISQALSSIFTPKAQDEDMSLTTPINLVKPAIENKVAFLALPPTIRVIEPPDQLAPLAQPTAADVPVPATPQGPGADQATGLSPMDTTGVPPVSQLSTPPVPGVELGAMPPVEPPPTPQLPNVEGGLPVPAAPGPTNDDWATDFADRLEKVIQTLLSQSNMPQRCRDVAWSMSAMDGAVIGVWPDLRHGRPRIFTRTPQDFYPVSYDPDGLELKMALWVETVTGNDIAARYGDAMGKKYAGREEVDLIQCIDENAYYTVLDKNEWAHPPMENMMGLVPIVCVGNLGLPGMIFGSTDIKDAIPVAKEINYHMALIDEMASALSKPTVAIRDPLSVPEGFGIGRGGTITMGKEGSVELLGPLNLPNAFWQLGAQLQSWFDIIADNPNVLRSDDGGGLSTGQGFNAKLGPIAARMQVRLEIMMSAWRQVLKYMLLMWANFPGMKPVASSGVKFKESFYIEATPQEFFVNGEMWTEMDVFLSAQSYMDRQGNAVEIMQLYQNELIDWDTAVDNLQQVTNRKRTRSKIDKDRVWKAEGMAIANQAANSAMTANVPLADQQTTNYGLERGFTGETPPMPGPEAQASAPPTGAPPEAAPPAGVQPMGAAAGGDTASEVVGVLKDFFSSIGKLQGAVWFGGDPILQPDKIATGDSWNVDVWITNPQDKGTITRAAENVEIIYGHLLFHTGEPVPDEQAIQVNQGSTPAPPGASPPLGGAPEGMPPDIAALMGGGM